MPVTIVAIFYVDYGDPLYPALARDLIASARENLPDCKVVMLTDSTSPAFDGVDGIVRAGEAIPRERLMPYRIAMTSKAASAYQDEVIFVDPDVRFLQPLPILDEAFDIALTVRDDPSLYCMPINTGVMISRPTTAAREFWREVERIALSLRPEELHRWWGDQIALALAVGVGAIHASSSETLTVNGAVVRLLDSQIYNCAAEPATGSPGAAIMHFKGNRKASK